MSRYAVADDLHEALSRAVAGQRRIGRTLDDDVSPLLSAAGLRLQRLRMDFPEAAERVREVMDALDGAMERVRAIAQELNPRSIRSLKAREDKVQLSAAPMSCGILLVGDHRILRDGIRAILARNGEFRVAGEARSGADAVSFVKRVSPDLVLMDVGLPGTDSVETTVEILRHRPDCRIAILSMYHDENSVLSAIRSGARAFILKTAADTDLLEALRALARGGAYLSPEISGRFFARLQAGDLASKPAPSVLDALSPRERQVLRMVAGGKTSKEIAVMLDLREQTVRSYRKTMMKKLSVNNVAGLTQLALSTGLTRLPAGQAAAGGD
jgi:DNA-binding NarL/FixJ family response regulator